MASNYPYKNHRFIVEIDGIQKAGFRELTMPDSTQEPVEYREGTDDPRYTRQIPGPVKYGTISLKWGITDDAKELYDWRKRIEEGSINEERVNISIILLGEDGEEKSRWQFANAWPSKYETPDLNATGSEVAIESLEIVHEGMERVK